MYKFSLLVDSATITFYKIFLRQSINLSNVSYKETPKTINTWCAWGLVMMAHVKGKAYKLVIFNDLEAFTPKFTSPGPVP